MHRGSSPPPRSQPASYRGLAGRVLSHIKRQLDRRRRQSIENDRTHVPRMAAHIDQGRSRAIGTAIKVNEFVP